MIITSAALLVVACALLVVGALNGSPVMLGISLAAAGAGGLCLFIGNASARRAALARGVPVEAVLAARVRRSPSTEAAGGDKTEATPAKATPAEAPPPPVDGYDEMPAREVTRLVSSGALPDAALSEMLVYEASHRRRRVVLTALLDVVGPDDVRAATRTRPHRAEEPAEPT